MIHFKGAFWLLLLVIISTPIFGQEPVQRLFIGLGAEGGIGTQGQYSANRSILRPDFVGNLGGSLLINALFYNRIGIELGAGQQYQYQHLKDKKFFDSHQSKFDVDLYVQNFFPSIEGSVYVNFPIPSSYTDVYVKGGFRRAFIGGGSVNQQTSYAPDNSQMNVSSNYNSTNNQLMGEVGLRFKLISNHILATGVKYNFGLDKIVNVDYTVSNNSQPSYSDNYQTNGSFVGIFIGFYFHTISWTFPKFEFKTPPQSVKVQPSEKAKSKKIEYLNKLTITQSVVKIEIIDPNKEDGDVISVAFNEQWILRNFTVSHTPHTNELKLKKGRNVILFQAENVGTIPPNTAILYLITNTRTYKVAFKTTMDKSQAIEIFNP